MKKAIICLLVLTICGAGAWAADYLDSQKLNFVTRITKLAADSIALQKEAADLYSIYFKNGYDSGGSNPIIAGDLTGSKFEALPVANITSGVTYLEQVGKLFGNQAVTQADYMTTLTNLSELGQ